MKQLLSRIFILTLIFNGYLTYASHVIGGEITYKHIKNNEYKINLKIYRDCNGCRINGYGGGSSLEDCSEIDYLYVRAKNSTTYKESKFSLTREKIVEISPICKSRVSGCKSNSNSLFGIEIHQFTTTVDLDDAAIKDMCNYYLYVSIAERNSNITTGQAEQLFCVDAFINTCLNAKNNSPDFITQPVFIVNSNKAQYQSFFTKDKDGDSLVYQLTSALASIDKEANYYSGFSNLSPLSVYCPDYPCTPDKSKEIGYYFDQTNGTAIFRPIKDGEQAVIVVKVSEYRKIKGVWELLGYTKRDLQVYVKTTDGNNSPKFINDNYFEICEEENFELKVETEDKINNFTNKLDSNYFNIISNISGATLVEYSQKSAPFNHAVFKWTPPSGASSNGIYTLVVMARDNNCPVFSESIQTFTIKVKPKEKLSISYNDLGCGNFEINTSEVVTTSKLLIQLFTLDKTKEILNTKKSKDTISFLPYGVYLLQAKLTSANGCITIVTDTLNNLYLNSNASITGDSKICKNISTTFSIKNIINPAASIDWVYNSSDIGSGLVLNKSFSENGLLQAIMTLKKGKWYCQDSLKKQIEVIIPGKITGLDEVKFCHNDGIIDLKELKFKPANGTWASSSSSFFDHFINTYAGFQHSDDTLEIIYNIIDDMNCEVSKTFNFIVEAIPEFDLSNQSICELSTPILFEHLIKKPFNIASYSYTWGLEFNSQNIKEENGKKLFYSKDLGNGNHNYFGEIQGKNGCKNRDTSIIEITSAIIISIKKEINLCQNSGTIDINNFSGIKPDGGNWSFYDFELITNKQFASTDRCGEFEATYTYDNYGCFDTKKIKINIECKPEITLTNVPNKICDNQLPITLSAQPSNGIWEGANITGNQFNPPIITKSKNHLMSYCVNKGICNFKEAQTIVVNPIPLLDLYLDKTDLCNNQPISISGSVSNANKIKFKYLDNSEESVISDSISYQNQKLFISQFNKTNTNQNIFIIAENEYGCSQAKVLSLNVFDIPKISPVNDTSVCENSGYEIYPVVIYGGLEPLNYMWIENSNIISNVNYLKAKELTIGKHNILITAYNTICWAAETLNIEIKPKPMVDFMIKPSETTTIMQPNFWFQNQSGINQTWLWNFGTSNNDISTEHSPKYSYTDTGNYFVTLTGTNNFGCTNTISKTVIVRPDLLIFIPNAFSPNNKDEEKNNVFSISLDNYATYVLEIYDRWGHKVFYSENPNEVWDGKLGDVSCPPDIYLYFIKINSITNNIYKYKGTITLIK